MSLMLDEDRQVYVRKLRDVVLHDPQLALEHMPRDTMYAYLVAKAASSDSFVPPVLREAVIQELLLSWYDYGALESVIRDEYVTDITVIGGQETIVKKHGVGNFSSTEARFASDDEVQDFVRRKLEGTPYTYSLAHPITDAILPDGYRMNVIGGPGTRYTVRDEQGRIITKPCTIVSIRKPIYPFTLDDLMRLRMFSREIREYLRLILSIGDSYLVAGGVGTGKTTFMNATTGDIRKRQKTIIIEEQAEMTPLCDWAIRLTNRDENYEGRGRITMADNLTNSLRMDADNLILGEARTPEIIHLFVRTLLLVKDMGATSFHVQVGVKHAVQSVLQRLIPEITQGAGAHATQANTASLLADKLRHIITLRDTPRGKKVTAIGEILSYDPRARVLYFVPVAEYDFRRDTWDFAGLSEDLSERAEMAGVATGLPVYTGPLREYVIA